MACTSQVCINLREILSMSHFRSLKTGLWQQTYQRWFHVYICAQNVQDTLSHVIVTFLYINIIHVKCHICKLFTNFILNATSASFSSNVSNCTNVEMASPNSNSFTHLSSLCSISDIIVFISTKYWRVFLLNHGKGKWSHSRIININLHVQYLNLHNISFMALNDIFQCA